MISEELKKGSPIGTRPEEKEEILSVTGGDPRIIFPKKERG